jgi:hypothetical protein
MLAVWNQRYEPVANNLALSALVAALPVIVLLGLLGLLRVRAHYAALAGLATAFLVALLVYGMPAPMATAALVNGALFGLFPIGWIVLTAMFVYALTVKTGQFDLVRSLGREVHGDEAAEGGDEPQPAPLVGQVSAEVGADREQARGDRDQPHGLAEQGPGRITGHRRPKGNAIGSHP